MCFYKIFTHPSKKYTLDTLLNLVYNWGKTKSWDNTEILDNSEGIKLMKHNRTFLSGLLVLVFLLACTQTPEQRAKKVKEKVRNATVNVQTDIVNNWGAAVSL